MTRSNENRRRTLWITMVAGRTAGRGRRARAATLLLAAVLQAPARLRAPDLGAAGFRARRPLVRAASWRWRTRDRRAVRQERRQAAQHRRAARPRASRSPPIPAPSAAVRASWRTGRTRRHDRPGHPGLKRDRRPTSSPIRARRSTTSGTLRTLFLQFENADWEQELAAFNNTDVEVPATRDRRRQDLSRTSASTSAARRRS